MGFEMEQGDYYDTEWEGSLEAIYAEYVTDHVDHPFFKQMSEQMLGSDWRKRGEKIVKEYCPQCVTKFSKHVSDGTN